MTEPKRVADIMTRDPMVLREEDNLSHIAEDMDRYQLRHLPVVDDGRLVGLVSHRDILRYTVSALESTGADAARNERLQQDTFVAEIMTRDVATVKPDSPVTDAARILLEGKFGCVPVVDADGKLHGIVSEHDLLRYLIELLDSNK